MLKVCRDAIRLMQPLQVAQYAAQLENYTKAIQIYEQVKHAGFLQPVIKNLTEMIKLYPFGWIMF
jgi:hypothetical protein